LAEDVIDGIRDVVLVVVLDKVVCKDCCSAGGLGVIGECGDGGYESGEEVEKAFLLREN